MSDQLKSDGKVTLLHLLLSKTNVSKVNQTIFMIQDNIFPGLICIQLYYNKLKTNDVVVHVANWSIKDALLIT